MTDVPDFRRTDGSKLTDGEWQQLQRLIQAVRDLQAADTAQQATLADHEARLIVFGPDMVSPADAGLGVGAFAQFGAGQQQFGYNREIQRFVNDLSTRHLADNQKWTRKGAAKNRQTIKHAQKVAEGYSGQLRNRSLSNADDARDRNTNILRNRESAGLDALAQDRSAGIHDIRSDRATGLDDISRTRRDGLHDIRGDRRDGLGDIADTRRANLAGARSAEADSLRYFNPAIRAGNNALAGMTDVLGLTNGGYSLDRTPATQYLLKEGRKVVEGGAAGSGGLYSGETLTELEKMRHGLVAQDYETQMAQLYGLVGTGQTAGANAATVQGQTRDAMAGYRNDATMAQIGLRDATTGQMRDVRNDATKAQIGLRDATTGQIRDVRNTATGGSNVLRGFYGSAMTGVNDRFADRTDLANTNYANGMTNASDTAASRNIDNNGWMTNSLITNNNNRIDQYLGGTRSTMPGINAGITNSGDAIAGGMIAGGNAYNAGIENNYRTQGIQNSTQPYNPSWMGSLYNRTPSNPLANGQYQY